jgi:hypothetical protein
MNMMRILLAGAKEDDTALLRISLKWLQKKIFGIQNRQKKNKALVLPG